MTWSLRWALGGSRDYLWCKAERPGDVLPEGYENRWSTDNGGQGGSLPWVGCLGSSAPCESRMNPSPCMWNPEPIARDGPGSSQAWGLVM